MGSLPVSLKELDRVEVLTLMDNYVDVLLENTAIVTRPPKATGEELPTDTFLAEHGLCLLVKVQRGTEKHTILFDTGYNNMGVLHNMDKLAVDPAEMEANRFASEEPTMRTVDVLQFCSWSACRISSRLSARLRTSGAR